MTTKALSGLTVIDLAGSIATGYCARLYADYGARVINLEPSAGFPTRSLRPFVRGTAVPESSAMHAFLSTGKESVVIGDLTPDQLDRLISGADLVIDDGNDYGHKSLWANTRLSIEWYGSGPYKDFNATDAQMFAINGMLRNIGHEDGPPIMPQGCQAQIVGGLTAYVASLSHVLGREMGNQAGPSHVEVSIADACMCFSEVAPIGIYNTGIEGRRLGINRFPPTYPLGIFPCKDGWLGVTALTPSQWRSFCELIELPDLAVDERFRSVYARLQAREELEPQIEKRLLQYSAEDLFYRGQAARVPLARVPSLEELFGVDQFLERNAFTQATLASGKRLTVPSVPFRLFSTPPNFGGTVATLGQHTGDCQ